MKRRWGRYPTRPNEARHALDKVDARRNLWLWAILGAAFALRLAPLAWWEPESISDAADYLRIANDLVGGRGFVDINGDPSSFRAPVYPFFVSVVFRVFGESTLAVRALQAAIDTATVGIVYWVARHTLGQRWKLAPLVAAALVAVNLGQITAAQRILSETVFTLLFVAAVGASVMWSTQEDGASGKRWGAATGVLLALATLTRGVMIAYPVVFLFAVWTARRRLPSGSLLVVLCFVLTLAPWTARNYRAHGAFVPVSTQVGITLYASYNPPDGVFGFQPSDAVVQEAEALPEAEASKVLTKAAIDTAFASPARTLRLEALKTLYFWSPVDWELLPRYGVINPTYLWIVVMAFLGIVLPASRRTLVEHWPLVLPLVYLFGMALVFHGSPRYRLPSEPLMALGATAAVCALAEKGEWRRAAGFSVGLVLVAASLAVYSDRLRAWVRPWISGS